MDSVRVAESSYLQIFFCVFQARCAISDLAEYLKCRYRGKMAPTSDAPVKVGAPHMSMIEPVAFMCVNLGMFVAEASNFQFGPLKWLVQCMQPILFDRFDPGTWCCFPRSGCRHAAAEIFEVHARVAVNVLRNTILSIHRLAPEMWRRPSGACNKSEVAQRRGPLCVS